jgi:hypothetical protein
MKAIYLKPTLKIKKIDAAVSMLARSGENNLIQSGNGYTELLNSKNEVSGSSALSKQGSFLGNQWDDEE